MRRGQGVATQYIVHQRFLHASSSKTHPLKKNPLLHFDWPHRWERDRDREGGQANVLTAHASALEEPVSS
jgi:hypothetical protein